MMTGMILTDLQKAFDTIDHDVLLQKLYAIGFSKCTANWFKSYLSNRSVKNKFKNKYIKNLNIEYGDIQIKQYSKVKYLGCSMDETMSGEAMALNIIYKINNKLKFLYRKNDFLTATLRHLQH